MMYYNDKELIDAIKLLGVNKFYIEYENISSIYDYYNLAFDSILYELYYSENYKDSYVSIELNKIIKSLNKLTNRIRCINSEMDTRILHLEKICQKSFKNDISYYNENYKKLDESFDETSFLKFYKHKLSETNHKIEMLDKAKSLRRKLLSLQVKIDKLARDYNRYVDDKKEPETIDDYIKDNTSLVHFVFTNNNGNDYKLSGIDGFLFNCQFHKEKTPSLRVLNKAQNVRCFGCGFSNDDFIEETSCASIGYLMKKEDISKEEAISLINEVYELNISNRRCSRKDLVQKYRESLLSDEYKKLLLSSLNRMMNMYPTLDVENHINYLQKQLDTIGRIKNKNYQISWQRILMLFVGIGGLWFIPTFHNITKLSPFLGALCVLSVLWVVNEVMNRNLLRSDQMSQRYIPKATQYGSLQQILFVMGIMLAMGVVTETGVFADVAEWIDENVHDIWVLGVVSGLLSGLVDTFTIAISDISLYPVLNSEQLTLVADTEYMSQFAVNGAYWKVVAFSTAVGGCLLCVGSVSGLALMKMEHMRVGWYVKNLSPKVLIGWVIGLAVLMTELVMYN